MKSKDVSFVETDILVICVDLCQSIPVSGNFLFIMVQGRAVLFYNRIDSFIGGQDPFYRIRVFYWLDFGNYSEFGKNFNKLFFSGLR